MFKIQVTCWCKRETGVWIANPPCFGKLIKMSSGSDGGQDSETCSSTALTFGTGSQVKVTVHAVCFHGDSPHRSVSGNRLPLAICMAIQTNCQQRCHLSQIIHNQTLSFCNSGQLPSVLQDVLECTVISKQHYTDFCLLLPEACWWKPTCCKTWLLLAHRRHPLFSVCRSQERGMAYTQSGVCDKILL